MLTLILFITLVMIVGDGLLYSNPFDVPRVYWVLLDPLVHAVLALFVISPLFSHQEIASQSIRWLIIAGAAAILIDVDHFIAANSLSVYDALHLSARPAAHSLLFVLICALGMQLLTQNTAGSWLLLLALLSHILRDASLGGVPFLWPLPFNLHLSIPAYYMMQISLCFLAALIAGWPTLPLWSNGLWQASLKYLGYPIS